MIDFCVAAVTDRGLLRNYIQDYFHVSADKHLLVVVGGVGGESVGTEAGKLAVQSVAAWWAKHRPDISDDSAIQSWLQEAIEEANSVIWRRYADEAVKGCTTIVAAVHSANNKVHVAHVGDSRAYSLRDAELKALTDDHRISAELVKAGKLTREQLAEGHLCKDLLTRAVGHDKDISIDTTTFVVAPGDWLLLCTDGLYFCLSEERIAEILCRCATPQDGCSELLACAKDRGAPDNIVLIAAQYI